MQRGVGYRTITIRNTYSLGLSAVKLHSERATPMGPLFVSASVATRASSNPLRPRGSMSAGLLTLRWLSSLHFVGRENDV